MDRRKALTISLAVDKDDSRTGNPLKIGKTFMSSGLGCKHVQTQVHWTQITGTKVRHPDTHTHKNGCRLLSHNNGASSLLELGSKKPCLVLTDVLKTNLGKAYMNRKSGGLLLSPPLNECGERGESLSCRELEIGSVHNNRLLTPTSHQKASLAVSCGQGGTAQKEVKERDFHTQSRPIHPTPSTPRREQRSFPRRIFDEEEEVQAVVIGEQTNGGKHFTQVMERVGVLLSRGAAEDQTADEVTPKRSITPVKETQHHQQGNNSGGPELRCDGTSSGKRSRGSVLCLSGEIKDREGASPKRQCLEGQCLEGHGVGRPSDLFPKAGEDGSEKAPSTGTPMLSQSSSMDSTVLASPAEFIVLSSDEEEEENSAPKVSQACTSVLHPQASTSERSHAAAAADLQELRDSETEEEGVMSVPFSALRCGWHRAHADGPMEISHRRIIIPLKVPGSQRRVTLVLQRSGLRRYFFWDMEEHLACGLSWKVGRQPLPALFLLLHVSDSLASEVHSELTPLLVDQERSPATGPFSPFLLLILSNPLEGLDSALLNSILDLNCLNNAFHHGDSMDLPGGPINTMSDCLMLINSSGLGPKLLADLDMDLDNSGVDSDNALEETQPYPVHGTGSPIQLEAESLQEENRLAEPQTVLPPQAEAALVETEVEPAREISPLKVQPVYTLCHRRARGSNVVSLSRPDSTWTKYKHLGPARSLIQFPPPPLKGGIPVSMEDLQCLDSGQFLNDVIIDFYLKFLLLKRAPEGVAERSHIFSSFFYKQLTRRDNGSEETSSASSKRQRRHQRVKNWTRHVDIFSKDFLFVPVNQESHWYLVVICFPGLAQAHCVPWKDPAATAEELDSGQPQAEGESQGSTNAEVESQRRSSQSESQDRLTGAEHCQVISPPSTLNCTEQTCQRASVCKRPCILIMDSLKVSRVHERVLKLMREYLQSEWEVRQATERDFCCEQMTSSHCGVPLQDNSSDCGLYLLQYVESFLKDPVVHFDLPLCLEHWFPQQLVRRKRDEIRDLVLYLHRVQNPANVGL